jgi:hypothetical protein
LRCTRFTQLIAVFAGFIDIHIMMGMLNQSWTNTSGTKRRNELFQQRGFPVPLQAEMATTGIIFSPASSANLQAYSHSQTLISHR